MAIEVVIVDQFSGFTPAYFEKLKARGEQLTVADFRPGGILEDATRRGCHPPYIAQVPEDFTPPMATTVLRPDADGALQIWRYRWDSSG